MLVGLNRRRPGSQSACVATANSASRPVPIAHVPPIVGLDDG